MARDRVLVARTLCSIMKNKARSFVSLSSNVEMKWIVLSRLLLVVVMTGGSRGKCVPWYTKSSSVGLTQEVGELPSSATLLQSKSSIRGKPARGGVAVLE